MPRLRSRRVWKPVSLGTSDYFLQGSLVAAFGYLRQQKRRYSYREWRRNTEWKLARLEAAAKLKGAFGHDEAKIAEVYRESLARLDELEWRALEGPEPGPRTFRGWGIGTTTETQPRMRLKNPDFSPPCALPIALRVPRIFSRSPPPSARFAMLRKFS